MSDSLARASPRSSWISLVVDDRADVHVNSADGRFYLGWFPLGRAGTDGGWKIAVTGTAKVRGCSISFDVETPAVVAAAA